MGEKRWSDLDEATSLDDTDQLVGIIGIDSERFTLATLRAQLNIGNQVVSGDITADAFIGDGAGLTGIASGTGGIINTGSTTIGADSDADGVGVVALQTRGITRVGIDNDGIITQPSQPAFQVTKVDQLNIAVGSAVLVTWNAEVFDLNSDFDLATEIFTAPVTGKYLFGIHIRLNNLDTASDFYQIQLETSNRTYRYTFDPGQFATDVDSWSTTFSILADMDSADTAKVNVLQQTGSSQTDIDEQSFWFGHLQM